MTTTIPTPPTDLRERGRAMWRRYQAEFALDARETDVLERICRLADLEGDLVAELEAGAGDRERGRLLATTNLICRLLSSLDLPGAGVTTPRQQRAGNAAAARWRAHNEVAAKRKELGRG